MDIDKILNNAIGAFIGTTMSLCGVIAVKKIHNNLTIKFKEDSDLKKQIATIKNEIEVYTNMALILSKESSKIVGYITENTMNFNELKQFDAKLWSDKLTVVNEAWKNAEVQKKLYETKLDVLMKMLVVTE